ncbi:MAG: riboflavin synthase [Muribaculaceae bacterium]|nr:riboflavin synthase [Muribaculaceae bacterium]MDE6320727.1 riboflavin synthase [Muribaculaceae bacterium]
MFSGIVEEAARVERVERQGGNVNLTVRCSFVDELRIDQSVAHNGVCLTVVSLNPDGTYTTTAIQETLDRSNLGDLKEGSLINLERCMVMNGRLDGHIVQGHVDCTATCTAVEQVEGSTYFTFSYSPTPELLGKGYFTVEKGSITVNGVSLTVCDSEMDSFRVAIIPYTMEHTNFCEIKEGTRVNLEFDIIGKYVCRLQQIQNIIDK